MTRAIVLCMLAAATAVAAASAATGPPSEVTARVLVSPISVAILVPAEPVDAGTTFAIRAEVFNERSLPLDGVRVSLVAPPALTLRGPATQVLAPIRPGGDREATWRACGAAAGGYIVLARATSGPFTAESPGALVEIDPARRARGC